VYEMHSTGLLIVFLMARALAGAEPGIGTVRDVIDGDLDTLVVFPRGVDGENALFMTGNARIAVAAPRAREYVRQRSRGTGLRVRRGMKPLLRADGPITVELSDSIGGVPAVRLFQPLLLESFENGQCAVELNGQEQETLTITAFTVTPPSQNTTFTAVNVYLRVQALNGSTVIECLVAHHDAYGRPDRRD
jgi:hypothetical protein